MHRPTIGNEKELLEEYLHIQKMRFSDHLDYEIHMEKAILSHMIPKLILQPFCGKRSCARV